MKIICEYEKQPVINLSIIQNPYIYEYNRVIYSVK